MYEIHYAVTQNYSTAENSFSYTQPVSDSLIFLWTQFNF